MLFNSINDINIDIHRRIEYYLMNNIEHKDINYIISLIRSYLTEIKNIKDIDYFDVSIIDNNIQIYICKDVDKQEITINLDMEVRKIKINKIKSSNSNIKSFLRIFFM